jgi:prephenate dehydratase
VTETGGRVAFQGERGAYSEMAARAALGETITPVPCRSFDGIFEAVEAGTVELGILPIENTLTGSIFRNYDLLLRHDHFYIVGETQLRIQHCLIANPGVDLADVRLVRSHPQALAQCEGYLRKLGVEVEAGYDTAGSVQHLRETGARDVAALASRLAAEVYGMDVLDEAVEDDSQNFTRFLLLGREPVEAPDGEVKTSILFALHNVPGALFKALACFALRDVDLTKIESRPIIGSPWKYRFYLDYIGHHADGPGGRALNHLREEMAAELRVLGTYPRGVWIANGV